MCLEAFTLIPKGTTAKHFRNEFKSSLVNNYD